MEKRALPSQLNQRKADRCCAGVNMQGTRNNHDNEHHYIGGDSAGYIFERITD